MATRRDDWITPDSIALFGPMAIHDRTANPKRYAKDRWIATNALEGGASFLNSRVANIWGNSYASNAILYFLAFDPAKAAPADPRPSIAPEFAIRRSAVYWRAASGGRRAAGSPFAAARRRSTMSAAIADSSNFIARGSG